MFIRIQNVIQYLASKSHEIVNSIANGMIYGNVVISNGGGVYVGALK